MNIRIFEVGGCVRDELLGVRSKDIDFSVEMPDLLHANAMTGFNAMREWLEAGGFEIFDEQEPTMTIRARFPKDHPRRGLTADFVLCRKEGHYSDGRRPDWVEVGTLVDDLNRRDFTVNAMARDGQGNIIDPHNGRGDLERMILRSVGDPLKRMQEDALRAMRALRFVVCKGFRMDDILFMALHTEQVTEALAEISRERREVELRMMFQHDTLATLDLLCHTVGPELRDAALTGIKLNPTHKRRLPAEGN